MTAYSASVSPGSFGHSYKSVSVASVKHEPGAPGSFQHVYMIAQGTVVSSRKATLILKTFSRQLSDQDTGLLSTEWQQKIGQLIDNINVLLQNQANH
jgi:hypothetical protein